MSNQAKLFIGVFAALAWLGALALHHFYADINVDAFVTMAQAVLVGLGVTHINGTSDAPAPAKPAAPAAGVTSNAAVTGQSGYSTTRFLALLAFLAVIVAALSACTTTTASLARGYYTEGKAGVQTWDDNTLVAVRDVFCAQPYSAIIRHPEVQPGVAALCGSMANTAAIDPAQVQLMLNIAKQLNLQPAAAPASAAK